MVNTNNARRGQKTNHLKTDQLDISIIRHLWDGRTPYNKIATKMGITTNTVRARVQKLIDNGILQIIGLVAPDAVPGHYSAVMAFKVKPTCAQKAVKKIGALKGVVTAACITGSYDIMAMMIFNEKHSHRDFIFKELAKVEDIESVETFFVMDSVNWQLRYVL